MIIESFTSRSREEFALFDFSLALNLKLMLRTGKGSSKEEKESPKGMASE